MRGWDVDARGRRAGGRERRAPARRLGEDAVVDADLVVVCTPIRDRGRSSRTRCTHATGASSPTRFSIKGHVVRPGRAVATPPTCTASSRDTRSAAVGALGARARVRAVVDGIVWAVAPTDVAIPTPWRSVEAVDRPDRRASRRLTPERHDRLVAVVEPPPAGRLDVAHGLAATEEADEPDILLLAAGGFRDLTRLAASNPSLWSEILLANRDQIAEAIDLFVARLRDLASEVIAAAAAEVERTFEEAKTGPTPAGRQAAGPRRRRGAAGGDPGRARSAGAHHGRRSATGG